MVVWHFQFRIPPQYYTKHMWWCRIEVANKNQKLPLMSHTPLVESLTAAIILFQWKGETVSASLYFTLSFYKEYRWWWCCYKYNSQGTCYKLFIRHGKSSQVKVDGVVRRLCSNGRFCLFGSCDSGLLNFRYYYYYPDCAEIIIAVYFLCHSSGGSSRVPVILGLVEMIYLAIVCRKLMMSFITREEKRKKILLGAMQIFLNKHSLLGPSYPHSLIIHPICMRVSGVVVKLCRRKWPTGNEWWDC